MARRSTSITTGRTPRQRALPVSSHPRARPAAARGPIEAVDGPLRARLGAALFAAVLEDVPDAWLLPEPGAATPAAKRAALCRLPRRAPGRRVIIRGGGHRVHAMLSYDYAILRIVPSVEREEFVNAGVVLQCPESRVSRLPRPCGRAAAAGALAGARSRRDPPASGSLPQDLRGRRGRGTNRQAVAPRAIPVAGRAAQHYYPGVARA